MGRLNGMNTLTQQAPALEQGCEKLHRPNRKLLPSQNGSLARRSFLPFDYRLLQTPSWLSRLRTILFEQVCEQNRAVSMNMTADVAAAPARPPIPPNTRSDCKLILATFSLNLTMRNKIKISLIVNAALLNQGIPNLFVGFSYRNVSENHQTRDCDRICQQSFIFIGGFLGRVFVLSTAEIRSFRSFNLIEGTKRSGSQFFNLAGVRPWVKGAQEVPCHSGTEKSKEKFIWQLHVVLADDHPVVRSGIRNFLEKAAESKSGKPAAGRGAYPGRISASRCCC
jgi:hypothetical protein